MQCSADTLEAGLQNRERRENTNSRPFCSLYLPHNEAGSTIDFKPVMPHSYEIEIKSLLGSRERQEKLKADLQKLDPNMKLLQKSKRLNHYFVGGNLIALFEALKDRVLQEKLESFRQITHNFEEKNCSIRSKSVNGKISLVIKAAVGEGNSVHGTARLEFDSPVRDMTLEELDQAILDCGFKYQAKWSQEREEYRCNDMVVTLDFSPGYGYMAEFEIISPDGASIPLHQEKLRETMRELGAEEADPERLERMFAYYNIHWEEYYCTGKTFVID